MLDMKMIRENPESIRKMLKDRGIQFDLDSLLELDKKRRDMIISTDELRKKKNEMSVKISEAKKGIGRSEETKRKISLGHKRMWAERRLYV